MCQGDFKAGAKIQKIGDFKAGAKAGGLGFGRFAPPRFSCGWCKIFTWFGRDFRDFRDFRGILGEF